MSWSLTSAGTRTDLPAQETVASTDQANILPAFDDIRRGGMLSQRATSPELQICTNGLIHTAEKAAEIFTVANNMGGVKSFPDLGRPFITL